MFSMLKTGLLGLTLGAGILLVGCQSTGTETQGSSNAMAANKAVMCDKCQETWVKEPMEGGKGRIVGYSSHKEMDCPACKTAVENFFASGDLKHHCDICGGNMVACEGH